MAQELIKKIKTIEELKEVMTTMKLLSSAGYNTYGQALNHIKTYHHYLRQGFIGFLKEHPAWGRQKAKGTYAQNLMILVGTDMGLVGGFNKEVYTKAHTWCQNNAISHVSYFVLGRKLASVLPETAHVLRVRPFKTSVSELGTFSEHILSEIDALNHQGAVMICYQQKPPLNEEKIVVKHLLPFTLPDFHQNDERWTGRSYPSLAGDKEALFANLKHEYLLSKLMRAFVCSLVAENYRRMIAMQQAEQNITDKLEEVNFAYQQERQNTITNELIDIIAGAESMQA